MAFSLNFSQFEVSTNPATLMDLLPTLADLAEVQLPKNLILDGESLKRVLLKEKQEEIIPRSFLTEFVN